MPVFFGIDKAVSNYPWSIVYFQYLGHLELLVDFSNDVSPLFNVMIFYLGQKHPEEERVIWKRAKKEIQSIDAEYDIIVISHRR